MSGLRLINCDSEHVEDAPENVRYSALSYVWGKPEAGSYETSQTFQRTVQDAIVATKELGLKFLWVDKHCIDQEDAEEKHRQIKNMNHIYRRAVVTLVAAAGTSASHGLPGVNGTPREVLPNVSLSVDSSLTMFYPAQRYVPRSKWALRGWTMQEVLLSTRSLIFTPHQLYFECDGFNCNDAVVTDLPLMHFGRSEPEVISPRDFSDYNIFTLVKYLTKGRFYNLWAKTSRAIATEYCERDLSFQTDGYKAFARVEAQLCSTFSVFSIWGITYAPPGEQYTDEIDKMFTTLSQNLLWCHHMVAISLDYPYRRSLDSEGLDMQEPNDEASSWIPSWSFVGWKGKIDYPPCEMTSTPGIETSVEYFTYIENAWLEFTPNHKIDILEASPDNLANFSTPRALHLEVPVLDNYFLQYDRSRSSWPRVTLRSDKLKDKERELHLILSRIWEPSDFYTLLQDGTIELLLLNASELPEPDNRNGTRKNFLVTQREKNHSYRIGTA
jgi:hypothetical protein